MRVHKNFNSHLPVGIRQRIYKTMRRIKSFRDSDFITRDLYYPSTHLLGKEGKLLRPALLFLGAQSIGSREDFTDLAAAIELLHVSSLIHDDIIDNSRTRRGAKSVNTKYGNSTALLAGNALISKAIQLSAKYGERVMMEVSDTALQMCAGELMDYNANGSGALGLSRCLSIARLKTAALIGTSCGIVATYKGSKARAALYDCGVNIGMAFQIRDDILDILEDGKADRKGPHGANIVTALQKTEGLDDMEALRRAAKLNSSYVSKALSSVRGNRMERLIRPYAGMMEVQVG
ncbi:MAG: polyprenyl synthetase family protein [Candidatus Micrarchaeota archaeon]|nr:polyprenyl synthetase family protein [Candidatus Micrarchaeota archaeon]